MPTDSPHIDGKMKPFQLAISPLLWSKNKPDRFDSFSCGKSLPTMKLSTSQISSSLASLTVGSWESCDLSSYINFNQCTTVILISFGRFIAEISFDWVGKPFYTINQRWFAGLVLMQLAVPKLRTISALKSFNQQFRKSGYNLQTWKKRQALPESETAILDHDDGLGWSLAGALLRPRGIQVWILPLLMRDLVIALL